MSVEWRTEATLHAVAGTAVKCPGHRARAEVVAVASNAESTPKTRRLLACISLASLDYIPGMYLEKALPPETA